MEKKVIAVGKFIPVVSIDTPPKPPDIDTNKESLQTISKRQMSLRL